ncbi:DUF4352 domain-containing protein (plasmid) [Haloarcula sp. NS06]|uniref:DUF4352 domain-containing protein n=1 Tax=Haloarcula sp. NS06 TaxID=3409688 RepID=UPI003DA727E8
MRRRTYLAVYSTAILAGCGSSTDGGGATTPPDTPTEEQTTSLTANDQPSPQPTPEPTGAEFELVSMDFPDEVALEENYVPEIAVQNVGDTTGTLEVPMYSRVADSDWRETGTWDFTDVGPGMTERAQGNDEWHHNYLYEYEYSLGDFDQTVSVDTTPFRTSVGETYPAPNGVNVTVTQVRLTARYEYQDYDDETAAKEAPDGSQWALITVRAENTAEESARLPSTYDVNLVAGQSQYEETYIDKDENQYDGGEVQPGIVREGWIAYELPEDVSSEDIEVVWNGLPNGGEITALWTAE